MLGWGEGQGGGGQEVACACTCLQLSVEVGQQQGGEGVRAHDALGLQQLAVAAAGWKLR